MNRYGLLGPHVNRGAPELVARWKPAIAVVLDHNEGWQAIKAASPATRLIGRIVSDNQPDFNQGLDPVQAARDHVASVLRMAVRMGNVYDWWIGVNEPAIDSAEAMTRYCAFEQERMRLLRERGIRAALGSFAVGNPPNLAWWQQFLPALRQGRQMGAVLALHQYWWDNPDDPWTAYRHEKVYGGEPSHGWPGLPADCKIPLAITEAGSDIGVMQPGKYGGWRDRLTDDGYLAELERFDQRLQRALYCIGAAVYCLDSESWKWSGYDIRGPVADTLAGQAEPIYRDERIIPPGPGPARANVSGVDVSHWQRRVPWAWLWEMGYRFAWLRLSGPVIVNGKLDYSRVGKDERLDEHYKQARASGFLVGGYPYLVRDVDRQAQVAFDAIGGRPFPLGFCLDAEENNLTRERIWRFLDAFDPKIRGTAGLYFNLYGYQRWGLEAKLSGRVRWAARPGIARCDIPGWTYWQKGQKVIDGVLLDVDEFNGTIEQLYARYGKG